jgi:hypothetical protein
VGGGFDGEESSCLCSSGVVGSGYVICEGSDVVDVDVLHPPGIDGDVNNKLSSMSKGDVVVKERAQAGEPMVGLGKADHRDPSRCCAGLHSPGCKSIPK